MAWLGSRLFVFASRANGGSTRSRIDQRHSEPDRDDERSPLRPLVGDCPQRPEDGDPQDECEAEPQAGVRKALVLSPLRVPGLEEADLPQQGARHRDLDRDHRLEKLNRHFHDRAILTAGAALAGERRRADHPIRLREARSLSASLGGDDDDDRGRARASSGSSKLAILLAMAMFVLVVDTSLMNVSISSALEHDAEIMSNTALITLFKGQPKDVQAEIIRITRTHGTMLCRSR